MKLTKNSIETNSAISSKLNTNRFIYFEIILDRIRGVVFDHVSLLFFEFSSRKFSILGTTELIAI